MPDSVSVFILIAVDEENDRVLAQEIFEEGRIRNQLRFVNDGDELLDYLLQRGQYSEPGSGPRPGLIFLDMNIPEQDSRKIVEEIKKNDQLRFIPLILLVDSRDDAIILESYNIGVNSVIVKPLTFAAFMDVIMVIGQYWFEIVELPGTNNGDYL
ncbi:MAG: response regulator [Chloroflexi bacterium]|nr:response regulator [Chloroflexota bacterium]